MHCAVWYHLYNLKSVKNTHGGVLLLLKLQAKTKWFQIARSISYVNFLDAQSKGPMKYYFVRLVVWSFLHLFTVFLWKHTLKYSDFLHEVRMSSNLKGGRAWLFKKYLVFFFFLVFFCMKLQGHEVLKLTWMFFWETCFFEILGLKGAKRTQNEVFQVWSFNTPPVLQVD